MLYERTNEWMHAMDIREHDTEQEGLMLNRQRTQEFPKVRKNLERVTCSESWTMAVQGIKGQRSGMTRGKIGDIGWIWFL